MCIWFCIASSHTHTVSYRRWSLADYRNMIVKHETAEEGIENKVKLERFVEMIPPPPLIQLPWPGYKMQLTKAGKTDIKEENNVANTNHHLLYANCSSCMTIVHTSLLLTCRVGHLMCLPCWSNMVMALDHFPLNRDKIFSVEVGHQGDNAQGCGCKISYCADK